MQLLAEFLGTQTTKTGSALFPAKTLVGADVHHSPSCCDALEMSRSCLRVIPPRDLFTVHIDRTTCLFICDCKAAALCGEWRVTSLCSMFVLTLRNNLILRVLFAAKQTRPHSLHTPCINLDHPFQQYRRTEN